jgi:hypothetical protein
VTVSHRAVRKVITRARVLLTATSTAKPIRKPSRLVPQIRRPVDTSTTAATEDYAMPNCHSKTADGSGNAHVPRRCWLNAGEETMLDNTGNATPFPGLSSP